MSNIHIIYDYICILFTERDTAREREKKETNKNIGVYIRVYVYIYLCIYIYTRIYVYTLIYLNIS